MKEKYLFPEALFIEVEANIITASVNPPYGGDPEAPDMGQGGALELIFTVAPMGCCIKCNSPRNEGNEAACNNCGQVLLFLSEIVFY